MMRESDFHQVPNEKTTAVIIKQEEKKTTPQAVAIEVVKSESKKEVAIIKEPISSGIKSEKKLQRQTIKAPSPQPQVVDLLDNRETNNSQERFKKERSPSPSAGREASVASTRSVDRMNRDLKREERRDKERDDERKREKERRRNKREMSPSSYDQPAYYRNESEMNYQQDIRSKERERELSSVSNSSLGSPIRARSMEPPSEHIERDSKRRKIEAPKKLSSEKKEKIKTPKREKQAEETKEQRREKRKKDRSEEVLVNEKRTRKDEDKMHKNGDEPRHRVAQHHHLREVSPAYDEPREKSYKSSRSRGGY